MHVTAKPLIQLQTLLPAILFFLLLFLPTLFLTPFLDCSLSFLNCLNLKFININMTVQLNAHHGILQRICYSFNSYYILPFTSPDMTRVWILRDFVHNYVFQYLPVWHSNESKLVRHNLFVLASVDVLQFFLVKSHFVFWHVIFTFVNILYFVMSLFVNFDLIGNSF